MSAIGGQSGAASDMDGDFEELTIPYWVSQTAKRRDEDLRIGDYVRVRSLEKKYEIVAISRKYGSVTLRELGSSVCTSTLWQYLRPWRDKPGIRASTVTQALGDVLLCGSFVYQVDAPDQVLRVRKLNWSRESSWVEDEEGRVFELDWDETEFWEN